MWRLFLGGVGLLIPLSGMAVPWSFGEKLPVSPVIGAKTFHHLDSAGRKNIAVAGGTVAVIWEDNRSGVPQVYVAFKPAAAKAFEPAWRVSDAPRRGHTLPAFEPVIVALDGGQFLMGWEQDDKVWLRSGGPRGLHPAIPVPASEARQVTLATGARGIYAAWTQRHERHPQVVAARITRVGTQGLRVHDARPVDPAPPSDEQIVPALAVTAAGVTIVWEDRRRGHTVLFTSFAEHGKNFGPFSDLNEVVQKSATLGRGSGVTRAALAVFGKDRVGAAWMDKREFRTGYDIYGAISTDGGRRFGANEMVQDAFGESFTQWHPAIAGNAEGLLAVAWDDDRDGTSDIQLSWKTPTGWSDDVVIPPASGPGQQTNVSIALDERGNLHVVWIDTEEKGMPTRLYYAFGKRSKEPLP